MISICDITQHPHEHDRANYIRLEEEPPTILIEAIPAHVPRAEAVAVNVAEPTLDLHTNSALIGTEALDVTLRDLGIAEEAVNGIVELYAVVRRPINDGNQVGLNQVYRISGCWVIRSKRLV